MPFYYAILRPGALPSAEREALANDVTAVHCGVTGAPRSFVHVLYNVDTAGRLPAGIDCLYRANIRSGRTPEQKREIKERLQHVTSARMQGSASSIDVQIAEIEASYVMEGGTLLPEPGSPEEEAWKALD